MDTSIHSKNSEHPEAAMRNARPPVMVLGAHRSGTTLLVACLRELGLFCGARMGRNFEAFFFQKRNEWLMRRAGGAWDNPIPIKFVIENPRLRSQAVDFLASGVESWRFSEFTGAKEYLSDPISTVLNKPWGWKDPRMIFTFPLWRELYPNARILYIHRNGVDVAASLFRRQQRILDGAGPTSLSVPPLLQRIRNAAPAVGWHTMQSPRCCSITGAFKLWEEYVSEAEVLFSSFDGEKLAFAYEDFLSDPQTSLRQLAAFCGLSVSEEQIGGVAKAARRDRAFAFTQDRELRDFYLSVKDNHLMRNLGYGDITGTSR